MSRRLVYRDGDWIAVPLRAAMGWGVGVVARHDRRGGVVGYFFAMRFAETPSVADVSGLSAHDALRVIRFGDRGLVNGEWKVIGRSTTWNPDDWPLPPFGRRDASGECHRVVYDSADLRGPLTETPTTEDEMRLFPRDALSGSGAVERLLTSLVDRD